jgi:serine/threonine protein kinase
VPEFYEEWVMNDKGQSELKRVDKSVLFEDWDMPFKNDLYVEKDNFKFEEMIGKGGFGKVYSTIFKGSKYAVKEVPKERHLEAKSVFKAMREKHFLQAVKSPYLSTLHSTF